jgi:DNA-binding response OmpR family regulator
MKARILIVEDEANFAENLKLNLEYEGHHARIARDAHEGWRLIQEQADDLIVLDLLLPGGINGFEILRRMDKQRIRIPVMILTALDREDDAIRGLHLGAVEYVRKAAVGLREIIASVHALLRSLADSPYNHAEIRRIPGTDWVRFGQIDFSLKGARLIREGRHEATLTDLEARLLDCFLRHAGRVLTRADLIREVWGTTAELKTRMVDSAVSKLRKKLGGSKRKPRYMITVRRVGYRFDP